jgi:hypothetical protein
MKVAVLLLFSSLALAQQSATTSGPCSPIATENTGTITINCPGMSKQQSEKIIVLLKEILANRVDTDAILLKLDDCLKGLNPNIEKRRYSCNGHFSTETPNVGGGINYLFSGDADPAADEMSKLNNARQYQELLKLCTSQIDSKPEWLTPRLFCGLAYLALGDRSKAKKMLDVYSARKGPGYDGDPACKAVEDFLQSKLD